ncbi:substrate-binding domain-containing protein [Nocardioides maradonensis]
MALVLPFRGSAGMFGPSCQASARLAIEELNETVGAGGRWVRAVEVDGGMHPDAVAAEIDRLTTAGAIDAVVGWHISAVRQAITSRLRGRLPYVYTTVYEGGETSDGVFVAAETPRTQLWPAMRWLHGELGSRSWFSVGNDYVWPRGTTAAARQYAAQLGDDWRGERYVPLGTRDFSAVLDALEAARADTVLMFLIGEDLVHFNRQFARRGLDARMVRFGTMVDENVLLGIGASGTHGIYSAAGYFGALATAESMDFVARMVRRFGPFAPPASNFGEACYEGVHLLAHLVRARRHRDEPLIEAAQRISYGTPRGDARVVANHLNRSVYMARAAGVGFDVTARL